MSQKFFTSISIVPISIILFFLLIFAVGLMLKCEDDTIESDNQMIEHFEKYRNDFSELAKMVLSQSDYNKNVSVQNLLSKLKIKEIKVDTSDLNNSILFTYATTGFVTSGTVKGYLYSTLEPTLLSDDIQRYWTKHNGNEMRNSFPIHRKIDNNWYIYFYSN